MTSNITKYKSKSLFWRTFFISSVYFFKKRYEKDFKEVKPDFVSILIGINDTWRRFDENDPNPIENFEKEYSELITKIQNDFPKAKIMLMPLFLLDKDPEKMVFHPDLNEK